MKKTTEIGPRKAALLLGIRLDAVYSLLWGGKLRAEKRDGRWLIPAWAVEERLKKREAGNAKPRH